MHTRMGITGAAALVLLSACAHAATPTRFIRAGESPAATARAESGAESRAESRHRGTSALVIEGEPLRSESGSLLGVLTRRVAGMQVHSTADCPEISLRGRNSIMGSPNPTIYVNGTPTVNTCVLDGLNVRDVKRVEVYRMGVSSYAGYRTNSNGLIVVFLRDS